MRHPRYEHLKPLRTFQEPLWSGDREVILLPPLAIGVAAGPCPAGVGGDLVGFYPAVT